MIPFLYGQTYFYSRQSWPWADYAHGFMGLLESYTPLQSKEELMNRLPFLASYPVQWQSLRRFIFSAQSAKGLKPLHLWQPSSHRPLPSVSTQQYSRDEE